MGEIPAHEVVGPVQRYGGAFHIVAVFLGRTVVQYSRRIIAPGAKVDETAKLKVIVEVVAGTETKAPVIVQVHTGPLWPLIVADSA